MGKVADVDSPASNDDPSDSNSDMRAENIPGALALAIVVIAIVTTIILWSLIPNLK